MAGYVKLVVFDGDNNSFERSKCYSNRKHTRGSDQVLATIMQGNGQDKIQGTARSDNNNTPLRIHYTWAKY